MHKVAFLILLVLLTTSTIGKTIVAKQYDLVRSDAVYSVKDINKVDIYHYIESVWHNSHLPKQKYKLHKYDCTEYTNEFINILDNHSYLNISYTAVYGMLLKEYTNCTYCFHCWIEIDGKNFEATIGKFLPKQYYKKIKEVDECF